MATRMVPIPSSLTEDRKKLPIPLTKVELHVHLDGAGRPETLFELLREKKLPLPGNGTFREFKRAVQVQDPKDLMHFLSGFRHFAPAFGGDPSAIERLAHEFCEDEAANGVAYAEARFSPHLMASPEGGGCDAEAVVRAVLRGFARGEADFGVKARALLCCIRGLPEATYRDTLRLCEAFRGEGVVGIDVAGDEGSLVADNAWEGIVLDPVEKEVFARAREIGIRRTVHAGEAGPAQSVIQALDVLHAERIGHGYHSVDEPAVYSRCLEERVHFEVCPCSSLLTGAVSMSAAYAGGGHPVLRFARDGANFSINTDDPTVTGTRMEDEFKVLRSWGLSDAHLVRANFNALNSCFLPDGEKAELKKQIVKAYGMD